MFKGGQWPGVRCLQLHFKLSVQGSNPTVAEFVSSKKEHLLPILLVNNQEVIVPFQQNC